MKEERSRKEDIIIGIFLSILYFIRMLFLDADVKCFDIAQIHPIDELYYNELAVKIYRYGINSIISGQWSSPTVANARTFFIPSIITATSLKIFGNNFWGLKIPYVLMGFVTGVLLYSISKKIIKNKRIRLLIVFAYVADFNVFELSRDAVTVMPCMLACLITVYLIICIKNDSTKWFLSGFWSITAFCLVYMGLPFIVLTVGFLVLVSLLIYKTNRIKKLCSYIGGVLSGCAFTEVISLIMFQKHIIFMILDTLSAHSGKVGGLNVLRSPKTFIYSALAYWSSNQFRYNYLFLALSIILGCVLIYLSFAKKDCIAFILVSFVVIHWAQTVFMNNMTPSKATITFPVLLLGIGYGLEAYITKLQDKQGVFREIMLSIVPVILLGCFALIYIYHGLVLAIFRYVLYLIAIISAIGIWTGYLFHKRKLLLMAYLSSCVLMIGMSVYYSLYKPTYKDRDLMIDLGNTTSNGMVINGCGFNLYNLCECPASIYDHYKGTGFNYETMYESMINACFEYEDLYYIGDEADNEWNVSGLNERLADTPYEFVEIKTYERVYGRIWGIRDSNQVLCKKVIRGE